MLPTVRFFLNSYKPLAFSKAGRDAASRLNIPPFVDGSIRREPDLEHEFPAITCLCRTDKFAPRLRVGDVIAYMTVKREYLPRQAEQRRLTAVLRVVQTLPSHEAAAEWYRSNQLPLPNNCLVSGNPPKPFEESYRPDDRRGCGLSCRNDDWERGYQLRAQHFPRFVVCEPLYRDLSWDAPVVDEQMLVEVFGRIPPTRVPPASTIEEFTQLMVRLGISVSM